MNDELTCRSCRFSSVNWPAETGKATRIFLLCEKHGTPATARCMEFEYEPGTDEQEHDDA